MTSQQPKNWADYSDDSSQSSHQQPKSPPPPSHTQSKQQLPLPPKYTPTKQELNLQLNLLDELDKKNYDEIWMTFTSSDLDYYHNQISYLQSIAKKKGNIVAVQIINQNVTEILVYINRAYQYIQKGYDNTQLMKVVISNRNYQNKGSNNMKEGGRDHHYGKKKVVYKEKDHYGYDMGHQKVYNHSLEGYKGEKRDQQKRMEKVEKKESKQYKIKGQQAVVEDRQLKEDKKEQKRDREQKRDKQQKRDKKQKSKKAGTKTSIKSSNRFEGIQDLD